MCIVMCASVFRNKAGTKKLKYLPRVLKIRKCLTQWDSLSVWYVTGIISHILIFFRLWTHTHIERVWLTSHLFRILKFLSESLFHFFTLSCYFSLSFIHSFLASPFNMFSLQIGAKFSHWLFKRNNEEKREEREKNWRKLDELSQLCNVQFFV